VAGAFDLGQRTTLRGAWGIYRQVEEINEISVEDGEDGFYPAQKAEQYDLGLEHKFSEGAEVRVEGYLKKYSDLRPDYRNYQDRLDLFPEIRFDRQVVYRNGSVARGIELVAKRDVGGMFSWYTSLALAEVKDDVWAIYSPDAQYTTIYNRTMSSPRDLRYTCHASLNYRPDESWLIGLAFQYHSGWPYTELIHVHMDMGNGYYADYFKQGEQWASRYPAYHRLDLRVNRYIPMGRGRMSLFVEVLNLYARKNQRAYTYETNPGSPNSRVWATTPYDHWLGFTPSAGISYEVGW
jgi:hypothetical protein